MVNFCCIKGCGSRSYRDVELSFFRIPTVPKQVSNKLRSLIKRQRREWIRQIHRRDITDVSIKSWHRVCSRHFLAGKPASVEDDTDPDWIPNLHLGHHYGVAVDPEKFDRLQKRNRHKEHPVNVSREAADSRVTIDQETQTDLTSSDISCMEKVLNDYTVQNVSLREELRTKKMHTEEYYQAKPERVKFYTGLPNFIILTALLDLVAKSLKKSTVLTQFQQIVLTLVRLRLNLPFALLADIFSVSKTTAQSVFHDVLNVLYVQMQPLVYWPDRDILKKTVPICFLQSFGKKVTVIIDCFEVKLERASSLQARNQTYSHYKSGNTLKFLVGITPSGMICFLSKAWGGRTSDKHITEQSDFLENLLPRDLVLADRGFLIGDCVGLRSAEVRTPAFTRGKKQLSAWEVESTRKLANVRIHVERVIGVVRQKYTVLESVLPLAHTCPSGDSVPVIDKLAFVCCALVNLCPSVVVGESVDMSIGDVQVDS